MVNQPETNMKVEGMGTGVPFFIRNFHPDKALAPEPHKLYVHCSANTQDNERGITLLFRCDNPLCKGLHPIFAKCRKRLVKEFEDGLILDFIDFLNLREDNKIILGKNEHVPDEYYEVFLHNNAENKNSLGHNKSHPEEILKLKTTTMCNQPPCNNYSICSINQTYKDCMFFKTEKNGVVIKIVATGTRTIINNDSDLALLNKGM